jgi:HSP20 family molecular chaperone IbpA
MTEETKAMEVQEQELVQADGTERMRTRSIFIPRADIYETMEDVVITIDMPGLNEDAIDITLEKNILAINGVSSQNAPDSYSLEFAEYEPGDYERSFRLTDQINREDIQAVYRDGVLKLTLPKAEAAKPRKISVKSE